MTPLPGFADPAHPDRPERLHMESLGRGPLRVTFLPGLGGTTRYWTATPVAPVFEDGEKTVTLKGDNIAAEFRGIVDAYVARTYTKKTAGRTGV